MWENFHADNHLEPWSLDLSSVPKSQLNYLSRLIKKKSKNPGYYRPMEK